MTGQAIVLQGNAAALDLPDTSVDLIVTSPPYWGLRSYRDGGEHYAGQIGSEDTPQEFLEDLWRCMFDWWRVLKPGGSVFVNLGDKRAGSGSYNNSGLKPDPIGDAAVELGVMPAKDAKRNAPAKYNQESGRVRAKSKMLLPARFAIGCIDGLADPEGIGWICRQDTIWSKLNGLPEPATDRFRDSHEFIFHFTKSEKYFAAMDEIREPQNTTPKRKAGRAEDFHIETGGDAWSADAARKWNVTEHAFNPLGKTPGSVWPMASEPLLIPQWAKDKLALTDHFAAFPTELPRRLILGFSPSGICVACGEGRRPVTNHLGFTIEGGLNNGTDPATTHHGTGLSASLGKVGRVEITGYACACTPYTDHPGEPRPKEGERPGHQPTAAAVAGGRSVGGVPPPKVGPWREYHLDRWTPPPTTPAVVLDPFGGTGTTAMVAKVLGRIGISVDLSADYCKLAEWRINESGHGRKAEQRTWGERQGELL